jgi:hypothetical protein
MVTFSDPNASMMRNSPLLLEVLSEHGLEAVPSDELIHLMSEREKWKLHRVQKNVVAQFRDRCQSEVEKLRGYMKRLKQTALKLGIAVGDMEQNEPLEDRLGEVEVEDVRIPSPVARLDSEVESRPIKLMRLIGRKQGSFSIPKAASSGSGLGPKGDMESIDKRLKEVNREILAISRRFRVVSSKQRLSL